MAYEDLLKQGNTRFGGRSTGGRHGILNPARHLLCKLSGVRTHPCPAGPRPPRGACHHAVPDRGPRGPYPSLSRRPHVAHLVQLVSAPVVPAMRLSSDRALVGAPAG